MIIITIVPIILFRMRMFKLLGDGVAYLTHGEEEGHDTFKKGKTGLDTFTPEPVWKKDTVNTKSHDTFLEGVRRKPSFGLGVIILIIIIAVLIIP